MERRLPGGTALLVSALVCSAFALWEPPVRDLAAHTFRADYFEQHGFAIWNGTWYAGHYMLGYSILFPPLAALLSPEWAGVVAAVASAYLFDRLVRARWGESARWSSYWFAGLGAVAMLANGWLTFALGVAFALACLRALQVGRPSLAVIAAVAAALSSPVAAAFLAIVIAASWFAGERKHRWQVAGIVAGALVPVALLALAFPEAGRFPFWFSAYWPLPLLCISGLVAIRGIPGERQVRMVVVVYLLLATVAWLVPNQLGGNFTRMGSLFGGPVLLAIVAAKRPVAPRLVVGFALAVGLCWQVITPLPDTVQSLGDPSTERAYYEPLNDWLAARDGELSRIEIPFTFNHWESAYVSPRFQLARGWLRQLDTERNSLFYEGKLTDERYSSWLREKGVRYVARSDAQLDYSAQEETDLVDRSPPYLRLVGRLEHWRIYEVASRPSLVSGQRDERLAALGPQSLKLSTQRPGAYLVRVWYSPYWKVAEGNACVAKSGDWTEIRVHEAGVVHLVMSFSVDRARRAATGETAPCP